jgi:hypothetical protein
MPIRTIIAGALLTLAASPCLSRESYPAIDDIEWTYGKDERFDTGRPSFRFSRDGHTSSFDGTEAADFVGERVTASLASPGEAVSFTVRREAGTFDCSGTVVRVGHASGTCRFDPDQSFVAKLQARNLAPDDSEEVMVLALVDARMASVEGLLREGFVIDEVDTVVALAALHVTPEFARSLKSAGLAIDDTDNLIAAKAVGVDPAWLQGMAEAGYTDLDADRAIQMRALDITPDYALKMSRVMAALEGTETE